MYLFGRTIQDIRDIIVEDNEKLERDINKFAEVTFPGTKKIKIG
jgi:hypothetical protein